MQTDNLNEVYHEGRTHSTWYTHYGSRLASWALNGLDYCRETSAGSTYELWQLNGDSQTRQFKGQYKVIKAHQKTVKVYQKIRNSEVITLDYIHTQKNLANSFTKGLSRNVIDAASKEIGLRPT
jgi:hypothetical protein